MLKGAFTWPILAANLQLLDELPQSKTPLWRNHHTIWREDSRVAPLMSNANFPIQPTRFSMAFYVSATNDSSTSTRYSQQSFMIITERPKSGCYTCYKTSYMKKLKK